MADVTPPAPSFPAPNPLRIGPPAHYDAGINGSPDRIILHSTVSACVPGGAEATCRYFMNPASGGSSHYVVDPEAERQCVWDADEAWHAPGAAWSDANHWEPENIKSIGIEMCDMPVPSPVLHQHPSGARWRAILKASRWADQNHRKLLHRTALLTAELCLANRIPTRFLSVADLHAGRRGISTHANVSAAFHRTDHWDPGLWPRRRFMRLVKKYAARMRAGETGDQIRATFK